MREAGTVKTRLRKHLDRNAIVAMASLVVAAIALSGCNTGSAISDGLQPTADMRRDAAGGPVPPGAVGSETALAPSERQRRDGTSMALAQPPATGERRAALSPASTPPVAFLPVTGAPQSAVTGLAAAMRDAAGQEAVAVVPSLEQGAQYQVKGYFSAINDGSGVTLVYVWDITDRTGARIHRISGQERGGKSENDPWTGVSTDMLESVARATMSNLRLWMSGRSAG